MHDYMTSSTIQSSNKSNNEKLLKIDEEYNKLAYERGAVIQDIVRIGRAEESRFLFEDADFSFKTIKNIILRLNSINTSSLEVIITYVSSVFSTVSITLAIFLIIPSSAVTSYSVFPKGSSK